MIVYIHGGGFYEGGSDVFSPVYYLERDVVFVVPQFRIDSIGKCKYWVRHVRVDVTDHKFKLNIPLFLIKLKSGFLSTLSTEIPGNAGLLDTILALEWIQENIKHFGGDNQRITLVGQSAGGAMVSALAVSPIVPNHLFHRIITQSSSSFSPWCYDRHPAETAREIGEKLGVPKNASLEDLNRAFVEADVLQLLLATQEMSVSFS